MSGYSIAVTGNVPVNVPINFVTNAGTAMSALNTINIIGAGGTSTFGSGNTVEIITVSGQVPWNDEAISFLANVNQGYFCTQSLTVTLPDIASQGNTVNIIVDTPGVVTIQAGAGQFISIGAELSSLNGSAMSTSIGDNLILVYRSASSTWHALEADSTWSLT